MVVRSLKIVVLAFSLTGCSTHLDSTHARRTSLEPSATWNRMQLRIAQCMRKDGWDYVPRPFRKNLPNSGKDYGFTEELVAQTSLQNLIEPQKPAGYLESDERCSNSAWRTKTGELESRRILAVAKLVASDDASKRLDLKWRLCMKQNGYRISKPGQIIAEVLEPFALNNSIAETQSLEKSVYSQDKACLASDANERKAIWSKYWNEFAGH